MQRHRRSRRRGKQPAATSAAATARHDLVHRVSVCCRAEPAAMPAPIASRRQCHCTPTVGRHQMRLRAAPKIGRSTAHGSSQVGRSSHRQYCRRGHASAQRRSQSNFLQKQCSVCAPVLPRSEPHAAARCTETPSRPRVKLRCGVTACAIRLGTRNGGCKPAIQSLVQDHCGAVTTAELTSWATRIVLLVRAP